MTNICGRECTISDYAIHLAMTAIFSKCEFVLFDKFKAIVI